MPKSSSPPDRTKARDADGDHGDGVDGVDVPETAALRELREVFADGLARAGRIYGLNPLLSHLYAAILLSPSPICLEEISIRAGVAKSTASVALRSLERWSLIRKAPSRPGDRRDHYAPNTDPLSILSDWLRTSVAREVEEGMRMAENVEEVMPKAMASLSSADREVVEGRLQGFLRLTRLYGGLFDFVSATGLASLTESLLRLVRGRRGTK